jgi:hypothetical protein
VSEFSNLAEGGTAETPKDFGPGKAGLVDRYLTQINIYDGRLKGYTDNVDGIFRRYRNKNFSDLTGNTDNIVSKRYSLLWSTVQTEQPALFTNIPIPIVERRWKDSDDILAQTCAEILNRALIFMLDAADFKPAVEASVFDYLMAGRGQIWLRKETDLGDEIPADGGSSDEGDTTNGDEEPVREVVDERLCIDSVAWCDFGYNLGRNWKEVNLVWRKLYMSRDQLRARFGDVADKVELDYVPQATNPSKTDDENPHLYKLATVYELWDKTTKKAVWVALGYKDAPLDEKPDPLRLKDFFPCPRPIFSSTDTTSLIPLPDFDMWRDQANEVDVLTARLHRLIQACQVRGVYNSKFAEIARLFEDGLETDMIPVASWGEFAQSGGLSGSIDFAPLKETIEAIGELFSAREQAKRDASEISGVADIMRGQNTGPEKSATEARISGQYGTLRLQDRQGEIQRFCRDIIRMMGELIAEGFMPETLQAMTGVKLPTQAEKDAAQMLVDQDAAYQAFAAQQQAQQAAQPPAAAPPVAQAA